MSSFLLPLHLKGVPNPKTNRFLNANALSQIHYLNPEEEDDSNSIYEMSSRWLLPSHAFPSDGALITVYGLSIFYNRHPYSHSGKALMLFVRHRTCYKIFYPMNDLPVPHVVEVKTF